MSDIWSIILRTILFLLVLSFSVWALIQTIKRSEDPGLLIFKWLMSLGVFAVIYWVVGPMVSRGGVVGAFGGIPLTAVCGLALAIIWRKNIGALIADPFASLYSGGDQKIEPKPFYSIANSKRKRGKYTEAISLIRQQLEKFPNDFEGQFMIAEIQAENLNDLPGAELTIQRLANQPGHPPKSVAFAFTALADWRLKYTQDPEGARQDLEKIIAMFPESEVSAVAAQRIGRLAGMEHLIELRQPKKFAVKEGRQDLGLVGAEFQPKAPGTDMTKEAEELVQHLVLHPLDTEARERLAMIYSDHYGRLDLAADQLQQLIAHPNQPAKRVVHWLNLLADLQIKHGAEYDLIVGTLEQIAGLYPDSAAAQVAINRIARLRLEVKSKGKSPGVKLGSYEQDIGLKGGSPNKL